MQFMIDYWFVILIAIIIIAGAVIFACKFFSKPSEEQLANVKEWLLWAVTEAEKELGGGTGKLKLRQVYDLFIVRFPWLAKVVPFAFFSALVDDALIEMRKLLETNDAVQAHVEGKAEVA